MKIKTPKGVSVTISSKTGGKINAQLKWNPNYQAIWENKFNKAQKYVDTECLRLSDKFVPLQYGYLKSSGIIGTKIGSGKLEYLEIYSRYQYYGKVMIGSAPKTVTNINLTYNHAPKRGAFWFERMKKLHKEQILNGARRIIKE